MRLLTHALFALFAVLAVGCLGFGPVGVGHAQGVQGDVAPLFPEKVSGFALKGVKIKTKSESWIEYSATYKGAAGKVKVVLNAHKGGPDPKWAALTATLKTQTPHAGRTLFFKDDGDKQTWMAVIPPRYRVDIKSRKVHGPALLEFAKAFPYQPIADLGE